MIPLLSFSLVLVVSYMFSFIFTSTLYQNPHSALIKSVVGVGIYLHSTPHGVGYRFNHIISLSSACERGVQ